MCSGHCRNLRRLLGPDGSVYHSALLSLLKELHTIWADLKPKGNVLDPMEKGLAHCPSSLCLSSTSSPDQGMGKKLHGEVGLPVLSEIKVLIVNDQVILFLFQSIHFSFINHFSQLIKGEHSKRTDARFVSIPARESRTFVTLQNHNKCN